MTFGYGQANAGCVLPLIANDEDQARRHMHKMFNGKWCGTYDEARWADWQKRRVAYGAPEEHELPTVDIRDGNYKCE